MRRTAVMGVLKIYHLNNDVVEHTGEGGIQQQQQQRLQQQEQLNEVTGCLRR
jgi:hypothetical protein